MGYGYYYRFLIFHFDSIMDYELILIYEILILFRQCMI